jgi:hypothetical protein
MKKIQTIKYMMLLALPALLIATGCKKSFLERPPTDAIVDANFYNTDEQVLAATALLYSKVWFDYNDKAMYNLGDFRAGTAFSAWNDRGNVLFNTTGDNVDNVAAWRAFFIVVGQSNLAINNINKYAGAEVTDKVKKIALAEARFMRALAYRFLVMNWGPVPIIENNIEQLNDTSITRNTVSSVWRFITREMRAVAEDLPLIPIKPGRITRWSAEGMLARFYLTRAGVESTGGARKQQFLDSAKYYSERVITLSGRSLVPKYEDLFKFPYDNNSESLFELQWVFQPGSWGVQNSMPAYLAYSPDIANGDGWGGDKGATWWIMQKYKGFELQPDGTLKGRTLDQRLKATFMIPGAFYSEITQVTGGVKQKLIFPFTGTDQNFLNIKKYVIGKAEDVGGQAASQNYPNDTYMMRLAEQYLIFAEASLGDAASTTDAKAMEYFNKVHMRSGLPAFGGPPDNDVLTYDVILNERMVEFAMEGMGWYDLVSLHYFNPSKAYSILNAQDRGLFFTRPDVMPNPTSWTITKTSWFTERTINANAGNFLLPIPNVEISQAPNLSKPPVDYP